MIESTALTIKAHTKLSTCLSNLAYGATTKKHTLVSDIYERPWHIAINHANYGSVTTALCEAQGSPAKVQILIDLEHTKNLSFVVGSFHYDWHKHIKCPARLKDDLFFIVEELSKVAALNEATHDKIRLLNN